MDALQVRLDVLAPALTALARAVPAELAATVQEDQRREVALRLEGVSLSAQADEALAADLGGVISAMSAQAA
jgi:hypothetical protein